MMQIGEMKDKIIIQNYIEGTDDNGFPIQEYKNLYLLKAKKKTISTKEYISAQKETTSITLKFICRKRNISSDNFVFYKNERYNIRHVHQFDDNRFIEITCEKVI